MRNKLPSFLLVLLCFATNSTLAGESKQAFFEQMKQFCGNTYVGKSVFPADKNDSFYGKTLVMKVETCTKNEIRVPFSVGEDKSRTWVLSLDDKGLLFKHDHRHDDGTPHDLTMYGGYANNKGTALSQSFPADSETKILVPKGVTNVWHLTIDQEKHQFIYYLERHNKPRFKAVFELK